MCPFAESGRAFEWSPLQRANHKTCKVKFLARRASCERQQKSVYSANFFLLSFKGQPRWPGLRLKDISSEMGDMNERPHSSGNLLRSRLQMSSIKIGYPLILLMSCFQASWENFRGAPNRERICWNSGNRSSYLCVKLRWASFAERPRWGLEFCSKVCLACRECVSLPVGMTEWAFYSMQGFIAV